MKIYYVVILSTQATIRPITFDLLTSKEIKCEKDFLPYYRDICSRFKIDPNQVDNLALHKVQKFDLNQNNYVVVFPLNDSMEFKTFEITCDEELTAEGTIDKYGDAMEFYGFDVNKAAGILLQPLNRELLEKI